MRHALAVLLALLSWFTVTAADWSLWRGPEQNGVSRERDLPDDFSLTKGKEKNLVFTAPHGGLGTPIVQGGQVYYLSRTGEGVTQQESVVAVNADTGKLAWEHKFNVWHSDIVQDRLAFTHMAGDAETGNVYAHLTSGMFVCFAKDGKIVWQRSLTEEFGRVSGYGGRVTSPIVDEDKVIISIINSSWGENTVGATRMVAFDKRTGQIIWWGTGLRQVKDTYYSAPTVAIINGERVILTGGGDGCIHAFQVLTGRKLWTYKLEAGGGAINVTPVVHGNRIYVGHCEENEETGNQGRVICLDASRMNGGEPTLVWNVEGI